MRRLALPPDRQGFVVLTLVAVAIFAGSSLIDWRLERLDGDISRYHQYAEEVTSGKLPYRDFRIEYPPGALPVIIAPTHLATPRALTDGAVSTKTLAPIQGYVASFALLVLVIGAAMIAVTGASLFALGASLKHCVIALGLLAIAPLLMGPQFASHFDAWPALLTAAALTAVLFGRLRLGAATLGIGIAAKLYPVLLVPLMAVIALRRGGRREAVAVLLISAAVPFAVILPFLVLSPANTTWAFRVQAERHLEVESVAASAVAGLTNLALKARTLGFDLPELRTVAAPSTTPGIAGADLQGPAANVAAAGASVLAVIVLGVIWIAFALQPVTRERVVRYAAIVLTAALILGRVLSPQYLVWLLPIVPLVGGRRGLSASLLLALALSITHVWTSGVYDRYVNGLPPGPTLLLLARNTMLVAILLVLALPDAPVESLDAG